MVLVQKLPFFQHFFLGNIGKENVFSDILEQKNAFLSYKNKDFKHLTPLISCSGPETAIFANFSF